MNTIESLHKEIAQEIAQLLDISCKCLLSQEHISDSQMTVFNCFTSKVTALNELAKEICNKA